DVRVLATDPVVAPETVSPDVTLVPLDALLRAADVVTLHVAYDAATRGMLGARELALLRDGAWLVNTARGELLDEAALLAALESGRLAGAALDVLADEGATPWRDRPLVAYARHHDNLILTPHIGGCTVESMEKTEEFMAERLVARLRADDRR
ncbi:MAG TPA: NAD(P)-dependent oxidoreductase, partial [Gemmatimonadaceae bacterium]|nr:NAD(P)-dependent oxidoreductase [Gemmatimonadaceae bacterium]